MWAVICPVICPGVATTVLVIDIPGCMKGGLDTGDIIAGGNMAWFAEENMAAENMAGFAGENMAGFAGENMAGLAGENMT